MIFSSPLIRGKLIRRYKRFLADIQLDDGGTVTAHCPNTGAMLGVQTPGAEVWMSRSNNPRRKLAYTWEMVRVGGHLVGVNTHLPNRIVSEAILAERIPELTGYTQLRQEVRYGRNSRIDILLHGADRPDCYVEIKNVHLMREPGIVEFPDAVSTRAAKHQEELSMMVKSGARAITFYLCQRADAVSFRVAGDIDPTFSASAAAAAESGVEALCYRCDMTLREITLDQPIPIIC